MSTNGSATEEFVPLTPEEVTPEWLTSVLGHKVASIEVIKTTLMATASKLHIILTYADPSPAADKPIHLCVKAGFNREMIAANPHVPLVGMYQKEADFYRLVAPKLTHVDLCKSYWAGHNPQQGLLLLEDLTASREKVLFGEPTEAWPAERVKAAVNQLAALHAATWGATPADYPWLINTYDPLVLGLVSMWQSTMTERPHPEDWTEARMAAVYSKIFARRNEDLAGLPHCLVHGDPHIGNTWRKAEGRDAPRFLDWQLIHVGSPFHDVVYFVVGCMTIEDRKKYEVDILKHYLAALERFGAPKVEWELALREYGKYTLSGLGWYMTPAAMQSEERSRAMGERYVSAILDHKAVELVEAEKW